MTQDPDYPEGHPKRIEQDALKKKKSSAARSPNESEIVGNSEDQEKDVSISVPPPPFIRSVAYLFSRLGNSTPRK